MKLIKWLLILFALITLVNLAVSIVAPIVQAGGGM